MIVHRQVFTKKSKKLMPTSRKSRLYGRFGSSDGFEKTQEKLTGQNGKG